MKDVHELEHAMKDFAYIAAQKDIEEWREWEELHTKPALISVKIEKENGKIDVTKVFRNLKKRVFSRYSVLSKALRGRQ